MSASSTSVSDLLEVARNTAGLNDFGDDHFQEGLGVLLETIDSNLSAEQAEKQRQTLTERLVTRLQMRDAINRHPEILELEIEQPMIVTGLPRSGTSALFNLLDSDPAARGLLLWETTFPQPFPGLKQGQDDPRMVAMAEYMKANRNPEFDKIHYANATTPEECCLLWVYSFDGVSTGWEYLLEPYGSWLRQRDPEFMYREHREHMQLLQWQRPGRRWLLKAPAHMWAIDTVVKTFPDASLVWGHREPVGVVASICSMTEMVFTMHFGDQSPETLTALGPRVMDWYASSLEVGLEDRMALDETRVVDYGFKEFIAEPRQIVERIYQHFELPMPEATQEAIEAHLAKHTRGKHGQHEYKLQRYGLSEDAVRERFGKYLQHPLI